MQVITLWVKCLALACGLAVAAVGISPRPSLSFFPKSPYHALVQPPPRCKTCFIDSHGDSMTDDSPAILDSFNKCNDGGRAVFRRNHTYVIGTAMDWTFLNHIDIGALTPGAFYRGQFFHFNQTHTKVRQTSRARSCSPPTPPTGKPILSNSAFKMSPHSSSWEETTCGSTVVSSHPRLRDLQDAEHC